MGLWISHTTSLLKIRALYLHLWSVNQDVTIWQSTLRNLPFRICIWVPPGRKNNHLGHHAQ